VVSRSFAAALMSIAAICVLPSHAGAQPVLDVAVGMNRACAVTAAGGVKCWGNNSSGQLGDGTVLNRFSPVQVPGLTGVVALSVGALHTCAVTSAGGVKCWGQNDLGQLGDGTLTDRSTPVDVAGLTSGVVAVEAGLFHTCAVTAGGGAKCWGRNLNGQLGDGTTVDRPTPTDVSGLTSGVAAIMASSWHTCAVTTGGGAKCWGYNQYGQLGDGTTTSSSTAVDVLGLTSGVATVTGGTYYSCALMADGAVGCWGRNDSGQLGDGTTIDRPAPATVSGLTDVTMLAGGVSRTCAVTGEGGAKCWGANANGGIGDGTTTMRLTPVDVSTLTSGVTAVGTGDGHSCALTAAGAVRCWGLNTSGQVGDGTTTTRLTPAPVVGLRAAVADFNADGKPDVLWHNQTNGLLYVWLMDGSVRNGAAYLDPSSVSTDWQVAQVADFNADHKPDVLWHNQTNGLLYVWFMNGTVRNGGAYLDPSSVSTDWQVAQVADFNADGKPDVLWHNQMNGLLYVWFMNGTVRNGGAYLDPSSVSTDWQVAQVADFNADGKPDVLWHNQTNGLLYVWFMDGSVRNGAAYLDPSSVSTDWRVAQVADFNADDKPDVLWHNQMNGLLYVWFMNGTVRNGGAYLDPSTLSTEWQIRQ